jgi:hypothetical protein
MIRKLWSVIIRSRRQQPELLEALRLVAVLVKALRLVAVLVEALRLVAVTSQRHQTSVQLNSAM